MSVATGRGRQPNSVRPRFVVVGLLLGCVVLLIPVLIAPLPSIGDYPNHLARMWLLTSSAAQTSMSAFYKVDFDTYTNIAIDLIALTVGKVAGYMAAGRLSVGLAVVLPPLGGALFWWSVHRQPHWWMLAFGMLAWGGSITSGFLNFRIAIGLTLAFAALEPAIINRGLTGQIVIRAALSAVLLLAHPFGLLLYALLLVALAIGPEFERFDPAVIVRRSLTSGLSILVITALFVLLTPSLPGAGEHSGIATIPSELLTGLALDLQNPKRKLTNLFITMRSYSNVVDVLTLMAFATPLIWAGFQRNLRIHAGLIILTILLMLVYLVSPDILLGAAWVDARFSVMVAYVCAASVVPILEKPTRAVFAGLLALVFVARTGFIADIWFLRQADVAALGAALEAVPFGSTVLSLEQRPANFKDAPQGRYTSAGENSFRHLPALAIPLRHAFVPNLFASRGKQPVVGLPPWDAISEPNGGSLADIHILDPGTHASTESLYARYVDSWRRFDFILVLNADLADVKGPFVPPPDLKLVRDAGFAKLYRVEH